MCSTDNANLRDSSSIPEISSSLRNVINRESPEAKYRSWNLWGYADSVPGIYTMMLKGMLITLFVNICRTKEMLIPTPRLRKGCVISGGVGHRLRGGPILFQPRQSFERPIFDIRFRSDAFAWNFLDCEGS